MEKAFDSIFGEDDEKLYHLSDAKLRTEDGYVFDVHRVILAKGNRYFYKLFCESTGTESSEILIPGVKGKVLDKILCYIYAGEFVCTEDTLIDLLYAGHCLLVRNITSQIKEYIKNNISTSNCIQILLACYRIKQTDILRMSFRFLETHFEYVANNVNSKIEKLPVDVLKELLGSRNLCVKNERIVWESIVKWTEYQKEQRKVHTSDLLMCLKMADIDTQLASAIVEHDIVARNLTCNDISGGGSTGDSPDKLLGLQNFFNTHQGLASEFDIHRVPTKIYNFRRREATSRGRMITDVYITYDENIDIWRKCMHIAKDCPFDIVIIRKHIYVIESILRPQGFRILNMYDEERVAQPENHPLPSRSHFVLKHDGLIYLLGGELEDGGKLTVGVQIYNPALNRWNHVASMISVHNISAASLGGKIYVTGERLSLESGRIVVQQYDPKSDSWKIIQSPKKLYSLYYKSVSYCERLFIFGRNSKVVEVFDPVSERWSYTADLPSEYYFPRAKVLRGELIVYEVYELRHDKPMVRWCNEYERWEPIDNPSPSFIDFVHFTKQLCVIEDLDTLKERTEDNRKMTSFFVKSPFN